MAIYGLFWADSARLSGNRCHWLQYSGSSYANSNPTAAGFRLTIQKIQTMALLSDRILIRQYYRSANYKVTYRLPRPN